jgi:hypothetical protein
MRIKEFFWFLAGAEIFILKDCPKAQNKFLRTGLIVFLIGIISGTSAGYAVYGSFDGNIYASIFIGAIWATIIITLDSLIVSTIKDTGTFWQKFWVAIPRIILSVFIGIVIARPAEIKIFEKEIKDKLVDIELQKCIGRTDIETETIKEQNKKLEIERTKIQVSYDEVSKELTCVQNLLTDERNGIASQRPCGSSSGRFGLGTRYKELNDRISSLKQQQNNLYKRLSDLNAQIDKNNLAIQMASNVCNKDSIKANILSAPLSLLQANTALNTLIFEDTENTKGVGTIILFVTILIVLIELLPVINKLFFQEPSIDYENKLAEFQKDSETMNYLNLIMKYPHIPARKEYLRNYQNNKIIHEKLLEEYFAISELNSEVQNRMDIILNKQQIQKANEQELNKQVADEIKESQIRIVKELITLWENETLNDIKNNPQNYMDLPTQNPINPNSPTP